MTSGTKLILTCLFLSVLSVLPALNMSIGNDSWSMGLSENDDDLMTWTASLSQKIHPNIEFSAKYLSFTDRGSEEHGAFSSSRLDQTGLDFRFRFDFVFDELNLGFSGKTSVGVSAEGDFGGETIQNLVHQLKGVYKVHLPNPYRNPEFSFTFYTMLEMTYRPDTWIGISGGLAYAREGLNILRISGKVSIFENGVSEWLDLDWVIAGKDGKHVLDLYSKNLSGPGFGFGFDFGMFGFSYRVNMKTQRGFGRFSFDTDMMKLGSYSKTSRTIRLSKLFLLDIDFSEIRTTWRFSDSFSAVFGNAYSSGYPIKGSLVTDKYRIRRNYGIWNFGLLFRYDLNGFEPYAEAMIGISHWVIDRMTNIDPEKTEGNTRLCDIWFPVASASVGFTMFPEGLLSLGPCTFRPDFSIGLVWLPESIGEVMEKDHMHEGYVVRRFETVVGLGVEIGF